MSLRFSSSASLRMWTCLPFDFFVQILEKIAAGDSLKASVSDEQDIDAKHARGVVTRDGNSLDRINMGARANLGSELADREALADNFLQDCALVGRVQPVRHPRSRQRRLGVHRHNNALVP
jgi:hypothetical protein